SSLRSLPRRFVARASRRSGATTRRYRSRWCAPAFSRRGKAGAARLRKSWTVTETYNGAEGWEQEPVMKPGNGVRLVLIIATAFIGCVMPVRAQDYPSRSITVIVPFPAGGASDVVARIVTSQMSKILGQSIVIENVGGAGGTLGSARAAAAEADGYTLLA